jgi:hypothetical protein
MWQRLLLLMIKILITAKIYKKKILTFFINIFMMYFINKNIINIIFIHQKSNVDILIVKNAVRGAINLNAEQVNCIFTTIEHLFSLK